MKSESFVTGIFIVIILIVVIISLGSIFASRDSQSAPENTSKITINEETVEITRGRYEAAKTAYADVLAKYNKMDDAYNCIQFYKKIDADPSKNSEYREALNSYPKLKDTYLAALAAYKETFPDFPLK